MSAADVNIFNLSEENIQPINKYNDIFEPKFGVFKTLDYDLNLDERKAEFREYDYVLCEDCNQEIDKQYCYCRECYNRETDCNEQSRMKYGIWIKFWNF